ncbi:XRE family transcriptional regulator [Actinomycetospora corticicola]|uniref:DNA-binding XRE family transcriptional regulator/quercetin dioxygenase-like cupin family protein n=1 Tax=Actinomycetospora corticicola TaxID=663602 RepID=A0A7Y9J6T1_9PSEU|nr:DNA-binding XRE family transcriptional regulator/quercetin dioxygenase-like cupin family protein [Actinomycetospora corticicola]
MIVPAGDAAERSSTIDTGPAAREIDVPDDGEGRLERAIGTQVRRIRADAGWTLAEMAARTGLSKAMLSKIENAQISCSLTTVARLASALDVPVTALFRDAEGPREAVFTPAGGGARIVARGTRVGHDYTLLGALRGQHKRMEAHLVTLTERSEEFPLFQHPGTELLFMLDGTMVYGHGDASYTMRPGDALQLDGEGAHGPRELVELPIRFLSVVAYGETPA